VTDRVERSVTAARVGTRIARQVAPSTDGPCALRRAYSRPLETASETAPRRSQRL